MTDQRDARAIKPGKTYASPEEVQTYRKLLEMTKRSPIPNLDCFMFAVHLRVCFSCTHSILKRLPRMG